MGRAVAAALLLALLLLVLLVVRVQQRCIRSKTRLDMSSLCDLCPKKLLTHQMEKFCGWVRQASNCTVGCSSSRFGNGKTLKSKNLECHF